MEKYTMVYRYAGDDDCGDGWIRKYEWTENPGRWVTRLQAIEEAPWRTRTE